MYTTYTCKRCALYYSGVPSKSSLCYRCAYKSQAILIKCVRCGSEVPDDGVCGACFMVDLYTDKDHYRGIEEDVENLLTFILEVKNNPSLIAPHRHTASIIAYAQNVKYMLMNTRKACRANLLTVLTYTRNLLKNPKLFSITKMLREVEDHCVESIEEYDEHRRRKI